MKKILGEAKTIRQLLSSAKYSVDFYQREYKWQSKQVNELIEDLTNKFLYSYDPVHQRKEVINYAHYFLGSIIISHKDGINFIVDGQQRLTTLTLLLIYLKNRQANKADGVRIEDLIFSEQYGQKSFNIDVKERINCIEMLYNGQSYDPTDGSESLQNIVARYSDIEQCFPDDIDDHDLPYFVDWLIDNVDIVVITAATDEDAYSIFETMNDRGLSLSPMDMLRGFVLAKINDEVKRTEASNVWKKQISALKEIGKDEDADAIKAWLRSQYAETIRERRKGANPRDFDQLGTEFHRWVRDHLENIGLNGSGDFYQFIQRDLNFYTRQYNKLRKASQNMIKDLDVIYYIAQYGFTLQYPVILAALKPTDDESTVCRKIRMIGSFIDILLARRLLNIKSILYSTMQYAMFVIMRDIRGKSIEELVAILKNKLDREEDSFKLDTSFKLNQQNRNFVHQFLARITDFIEQSSGMQSRYLEYTSGKGGNKYEIEHIWANHSDWFKDDPANPYYFYDYRDRIGGLLLVPKSFNASYSDLRYEEKIKHYNAQNLLARSLHKDCYERNPGFLSFVKNSGLPLKPYDQFNKNNLIERQHLYIQIAEKLWNPERLEKEALSTQ